MKIAVFCSANKNIDPDFFTLTEEMGKWMAENGHDLVICYGTMYGNTERMAEIIARAASKAGVKNHRCGSYACRARRKNLS